MTEETIKVTPIRSMYETSKPAATKSRQGKIGVQVWLDKETHKAFKIQCTRYGVDMSTAIRQLIKAELQRAEEDNEIDD